MLMAMSGPENLRTLGIYVNPSADAVADALARQDPGRPGGKQRKETLHDGRHHGPREAPAGGVRD